MRFLEIPLISSGSTAEDINLTIEEIPVILTYDYNETIDRFSITFFRADNNKPLGSMAKLIPGRNLLFSYNDFEESVLYVTGSTSTPPSKQNLDQYKMVLIEGRKSD